jgi:predicted dehydrogenase
MNMIKAVSIGGFGHSVFVFDDMIGMEQAQVTGLAPAYEGEDISFFANHQACKNARKYTDYISMLKETKPDVAIISTRLDLIPEVIIAAANAGCHIIAEKPLALDEKKLSDVYKAIRENNVKLMAMLSMRSEPVFIAAKDVYDSGAIGESVIINARKSYKYGVRPSWFGDKKKYGGTIGWVGIHALDFTNFITGLEFSQVAAMQGNFCHSGLPSLEDNCNMILSLSNGGHMTVSIDYCRPESAPSHGDDWIRIVGTKGVIESRGSTNSCEVLVNGEGTKLVQLPAKRKIFCDFLLAIAEGIDTANQYESFMLTQACLCGEKSAEKQEFIKIDTSMFR